MHSSDKVSTVLKSYDPKVTFCFIFKDLGMASGSTRLVEHLPHHHMVNPWIHSSLQD